MNIDWPGAPPPARRRGERGERAGGARGARGAREREERARGLLKMKIDGVIDSDIDSGSDTDRDRLGRIVTVVRQVDGVVEMATICVTRMQIDYRE
jgi:hypothetical protein